MGPACSGQYDSERPRRERRRGPITAAFAERELEDAHASDEALAVFFAYAKQYFEYAALFVVHGDLAAGNDAWGPGASRDKVRGIGVALDLPSALSDARDRAAPIIVRLNRAGLDADLRKDLSRAALQPVLVLPIMLRARCVALLYGDAGEEPVRDGDIGDVVAMAPLLARSLERILLRKKRAALRDSGGIKSKLEPSDTSILPEHPVDSFGPAASAADGSPVSPGAPPDDLSDLVAKRGTWEDEDLVDEGWSLPVDDDPRQQETPRAVPVSSRAPYVSPLAVQPPPPPQVAQVRTISRIPIAREEPEDVSAPAPLAREEPDDPGPEVTVEERDDDLMQTISGRFRAESHPRGPRAGLRSTELRSDGLGHHLGIASSPSGFAESAARAPSGAHSIRARRSSHRGR